MIQVSNRKSIRARDSIAAVMFSGPHASHLPDDVSEGRDPSRRQTFDGPFTSPPSSHLLAEVQSHRQITQLPSACHPALFQWEQPHLETLAQSGPDIEALTGIRTQDPAFRRTLHNVVCKIAPSGGSVLILGRTGTGKELVAQAIRKFSPQRNGPFVDVNCASFTSSLLDSELFGHVKGAFTGASSPRLGRFREADGGILFLDELGEMSLELQGKLLRVLETQQVDSVGGDIRSRKKVCVRVIAATSHDLEARMREGKFRPDLYYRLAQLVIRLPDLQERGDDVALLSRHFLQQHPIGRALHLSDGAQELLRAHTWPGNIRELKAVIGSLAILASSPIISRGEVAERLNLVPSPVVPQAESDAITRDQALLALLRRNQFRPSLCAQDERWSGTRCAADRNLRILICKALEQSGGQVADAARLLVGRESPMLEERLIRRIQGFLAHMQTRAVRDGEEAYRCFVKRHYRADRDVVLAVTIAESREASLRD